MHIESLEQCLVHYKHPINVITTIFLPHVGPDAVVGDLFPPSADLCNRSHLGPVGFLRQSCHLTAHTAPALGAQAWRIGVLQGTSLHSLQELALTRDFPPGVLESWAQGRRSHMAEVAALRLSGWGQHHTQSSRSGWSLRICISSRCPCEAPHPFRGERRRSWEACPCFLPAWCHQLTSEPLPGKE